MSVVVVGTKDADTPSNSKYIIEWLNLDDYVLKLLTVF